MKCDTLKLKEKKEKHNPLISLEQKEVKLKCKKVKPTKNKESLENCGFKFYF